MYTILIADDKSLIRQGIISMIDWPARNCSLAGEAENGREAIRLIEEKRPDIVITDIRMPLVDGLQILDYAGERGIQLETIVISGYDRFEYVHHALKSNSVDYILKPIHADELNRAVQTACERIAKRRSSAAAAPGGCGMALLNALRGKENCPYSQLAAQLGGGAEGAGFCVAIAYNRYKDYRHMAARASGPLTCPHPPLFADAQETLELVFPLDAERDIHSVAHALSALVTGGSEAQRRGLYVGVSAYAPASAGMHEAYLQAQKALGYKLLLPGQTILCYSKLEQRGGGISSPKEIEGHILDYLTSGNAGQVITLCRGFIGEVLGREGATMEGFVSAMTQLYCILLKIGTESADQLQAEIQNLNQLETLIRCESAEQVADVFFGHCRSIAGELIDKRNQTHKLISDIKDYITDHFREPISLKTLEAIFHHNAAYLSVLFKKENGAGFNKYVSGLRLEYAADLLRSTDHRLIDICELSGFSNYIHFSKVFKSSYGISPSEYRKLHADGGTAESTEQS